jgi:hypothetical protein
MPGGVARWTDSPNPGVSNATVRKCSPERREDVEEDIRRIGALMQEDQRLPGAGLPVVDLAERGADEAAPDVLHRGIPRPRVAMMFRCTSDVPLPIVWL